MAFVIKSIREKEVWDITNMVESLSIETTLFEQAGKATFTAWSTADFPRGSVITIESDKNKIFYGYVFETSVNQDGNTSVVAYDQMRYLKNEDYLQYEGKTADQIFVDICKRNNLKHKVVSTSGYVNKEHREKATMFAILRHFQDETLRNIGKMYIVRDNFGTLEFADVASLKTNLVIGDKSLMTDFEYTQSIDEDTYNVIRLGRDNKKTGKMDVWQAQDTDTIKKWGKLQYFDEVEENVNEANIKKLAENILLLKNRETRSLSFSAIGFYNLKAGDGIKVQLPGIVDEWFYINNITTSIEQDYVTMDIEVFIP